MSVFGIAISFPLLRYSGVFRRVDRAYMTVKFAL
jgi:hypothetical protein